MDGVKLSVQGLYGFQNAPKIQCCRYSCHEPAQSLTPTEITVKEPKKAVFHLVVIFVTPCKPSNRHMLSTWFLKHLKFAICTMSVRPKTIYFVCMVLGIRKSLGIPKLVKPFLQPFLTDVGVVAQGSSRSVSDIFNL